PATSGAQHVAASGGPISHQCAHCGTVFGTHLAQCPGCGQPVVRSDGPYPVSASAPPSPGALGQAQPIFLAVSCANCGTICAPQAAFCPTCGHRLASQDRTRGKGSAYSTAGLLLAVISIFIFPPLFGVLGVIFGGVGMSKGESAGCATIIVCTICMVVRMALGAAMWTCGH
ncbi:MAG: double zinc ribbon domain-containing protein, partial [Armatimonadota bacterium]